MCSSSICTFDDDPHCRQFRDEMVILVICYGDFFEELMMNKFILEADFECLEDLWKIFGKFFVSHFGLN